MEQLTINLLLFQTELANVKKKTVKSKFVNTFFHFTVV